MHREKDKFTKFFSAALTTIRDQRLYRERFRTFEKYCETVWNLSSVHVNRKLAAAKAFAELEEAGATTPTKESQARIITILTKEQKVTVMRKAKTDSGGKPITAKAVKKAKRQVLGDKERARFHSFERNLL